MRIHTLDLTYILRQRHVVLYIQYARILFVSSKSVSNSYIHNFKTVI